MRRPKLNVLLIGEESAGIQTLKALSRTGHRVVAVMATPPEVARNGGSLWGFSWQQGFPTWPAKQVKDLRFPDRIRSEEIDVVLNVHSLYVIPAGVLGAARIGCFNLHPGPLPHYAGLNTISWAIFNDESGYGVTVHEMTPSIDAGRIAYQSFFPLDEDDTPLSLMRKCIGAGLPLVERLLETAAMDPAAIPLVSQDLSRRRYFGRKVPFDGWLQWERPAREIANFVRACNYHPFPSPWGHPRTALGSREIEVLGISRTGRPCSAPPGTIHAEASSDGACVASGDEWVAVRSIQVGGRRVAPRFVLTAGERLRSYRSAEADRETLACR